MLPFCEPDDDYSTPWVNGGFSRCFLEVVGSISSAGILILLGLTIIVLGPKSKVSKQKKLLPSLPFVIEVGLCVIISLTYIVDLAVKGALHVAGEQIYGYTIVEDALGIVSWAFTVLILFREHVRVFIKGESHGVAIILFLILNMGWFGLQIVSFNNPHWWWHLRTAIDITDMVLYIIRALCLAVIVGIGLIHPLYSHQKTRRNYSLLVNADEDEVEIDTEERNKENAERKEGSFIRKRTTSAFSDFWMKAKLLFPFVWPKGTCVAAIFTHNNYNYSLCTF